jgi:hypothetical protein
MLVFAISHHPSCTVSGHIVHGSILFTFGAWLTDEYGGAESDERYIRAFVLSGLMNILLGVWAADLFWRGIDAKSVEFAKWFAEKCWANG